MPYIGANNPTRTLGSAVYEILAHASVARHGVLSSPSQAHFLSIVSAAVRHCSFVWVSLWVSNSACVGVHAGQCGLPCSFTSSRRRAVIVVPMALEDEQFFGNNAVRCYLSHTTVHPLTMNLYRSGGENMITLETCR